MSMKGGGGKFRLKLLLPPVCSGGTKGVYIQGLVASGLRCIPCSYPRECLRHTVMETKFPVVLTTMLNAFTYVGVSIIFLACVRQVLGSNLGSDTQ
jgi:hypothetical protein